jgi:toxin CcdB
MARFDLYKIPDSPGFFIDVQADFLSYLNTRIVVPLLPPGEAPQPALRLNTRFRIDGIAVVMTTQFIAAVPKSSLQVSIGNLRDHRDEIVAALDFLMQGF